MLRNGACTSSWGCDNIMPAIVWGSVIRADAKCILTHSNQPWTRVMPLLECRRWLQLRFCSLTCPHCGKIGKQFADSHRTTTYNGLSFWVLVIIIHSCEVVVRTNTLPSFSPRGSLNSNCENDGPKFKRVTSALLRLSKRIFASDFHQCFCRRCALCARVL